MHTVIKTILILLLCSSCAPGFIYTNTVRPFCTNMRNTELGTKVAKGASYRAKVPTSSLDLTAEWSSRAIGDIAKQNNIETINFCDKKTISILGGIFRKEQMIVYGE